MRISRTGIIAFEIEDESKAKLIGYKILTSDAVVDTTVMMYEPY